jgi:choline dehydrogenase-like flavoprotein
MPNEPVDVLIVGAGASGAAVAWSLADTRMRILCLDQGGHMRQDDYPSNGMDWEWRTGIGDFSVNPNTRMNHWDYPINDSETPIKPAMYSAVGGSTILWTAHFPRFRPRDFKVCTVAGVGEDWPLEYTNLEPFFAPNDRMMGVSGLPGDPSYPPKTMPLPPLPIGALGHKVASGFNELGWHWWPSDTAITSRPYEGSLYQYWTLPEWLRPGG